MIPERYRSLSEREKEKQQKLGHEQYQKLPEHE